VFRHATDADLPAIVAIYNAAIPGRLATADTEPVSVESRQAWFAAHCSGKWPLWVLDLDGEIAGWVSLQAIYDRPAWDVTAEVSIYVAPACHGQGLGARLLDEAIAKAPGVGLKTLLGYIYAHNEPSLRLFERRGFARWGYLPQVTEMDGAEQDVVIVGKRLMTQG
jgi:phosphinothricin acetyltransferase